MTLGYDIYDSCGDPRKAVWNVFQILSGSRRPVPNYSCVGKRKIVGFIGDLSSDITVPIAQILGLIGYSQISYGASDPSFSDRGAFPYLFRMLQSDHGQYFALSKLLKYFGWTWVGVIALQDTGDKDYQLLTKYLSNEGICIEFKIKMNLTLLWSLNNKVMKSLNETVERASTSVIVLVGKASLETIASLQDIRKLFHEKTFIVCSSVAANSFIMTYGLGIFHGSLIFEQYSLPYLNTSKINHFMHSNQLSLVLSELQSIPFVTENNGNSSVFTQEFFYSRVYFAVHIMSLALHNMQISISPEKNKNEYNYRHKLHKYLKTLQYQTSTNGKISFGENGEMVANYEIYNCVLNSKDGPIMKLIGSFKPGAQEENKLMMSPDQILWKTGDNKIPRAQCSDNCLPGFRKAPISRVQSCCYNCVSCSVGEISNTTDSESCIKCFDMEWPNVNKQECVAKWEDFLTYSNVISAFLSSVVVFLYLITLFILGVFITYRDTPVVKANNRSLSFLLLVSIKLSFLSVFLFLGRPVDITCMLRNITFGITFSIAVSSLLAKTIMVCVAFKATKPGNSWRKWVGVKLSNSVVLFCSSIQIIICMTWLAISPPFQELDLHTYAGTIIIQCNEGSAIGFYSVIGYMGLLAAVSFALAFLARTLPDSFNEAKYITFSMLLFCSVWITMIPAYLSTKGKNTVCVEIFAILTSTAGLLACIFLPKCYTIFCRPEMNTKSFILRMKI
ncbi:hypothetical protein XELAEV_18008728mg [Xenopus laevis]|uniref:G-protein coupled receptors family 3 profile domain-containing protein n=1 Tax=Xenopus laevis TaxID=8355 RepID=A0A974DQZ5_XENLA|nr:hypothetical protein XELAEV_18008728mg [Xenopus laevis]